MPAEDYLHPDGLLGWIARWSGDYTRDTQTLPSLFSTGNTGNGLLMKLAGNGGDKADDASYAADSQVGYSLPNLAFAPPSYAANSDNSANNSFTEYADSASSNTPTAISGVFSRDTILDRPVELMSDKGLQLSVHMGSDWVQHIAAKELSRRAARRYLSDAPVRQTLDQDSDTDNAAYGEPPPHADMQPAATPAPADAGVLLSGDNEPGSVSEQIPDPADTSSSDRHTAEPSDIAVNKSGGSPTDDHPIPQSATGATSDTTGQDGVDGAAEAETHSGTGERSDIDLASLNLAPSSVGTDAPYSYSAFDGTYGDKDNALVPSSEPGYIKDHANGWEPNEATVRRGDGWIRLTNRHDADPVALALANARNGSISLQPGQYVTFNGLDSVSDAGRAVAQSIWDDEASFAQTTRRQVEQQQFDNSLMGHIVRNPLGADTPGNVTQYLPMIAPLSTTTAATVALANGLGNDLPGMQRAAALNHQEELQLSMQVREGDYIGPPSATRKDYLDAFASSSLPGSAPLSYVLGTGANYLASFGVTTKNGSPYNYLTERTLSPVQQQDGRRAAFVDVVTIGMGGLGSAKVAAERVLASNSNATMLERGFGSNSGHEFAKSVTEGGSRQALAGHGGLDASIELEKLQFVSPRGTTVITPRPNTSIHDTTGHILENVTSAEHLEEVLRTGVSPGGIKLTARNYSDLKGYNVIVPEKTGYNYTLLDPAYGNNQLNIFQNSTTTSTPTHLSDFLKPDMGCVFWAACTTFTSIPK